MNEIEYINIDEMQQELEKLYRDASCDAQAYESIIEEKAFIVARNINRNLKSYVHQKDTSIYGNFGDIRVDWNQTHEWIKSEVTPWGDFDEIIKSIDEKTISDENLDKFQKWTRDWYFQVAGKYWLKYDYQEMEANLEYEREKEQE